MVNEFYQYIFHFWEMLSEKIEDISLYLADEKSSAEKYRNGEGGNLLFRPAGLKAYVDAVSEIHRKKNSSFEMILDKLSSLNLDLNVNPWKKVLWDDVRKSMIMNNKQIMKEFIFYNYDQNWIDSKGKTSDFMKMFRGYASLLNYDMSDGVEALSNLILQKKSD